MNSYNTDIFFSNYYNLQSVHFEYTKHTKEVKQIAHERFFECCVKLEMF